MPEIGTVLRLLRRGVLFELRLYRSLLRWVLRRPAVPAGAETYGYAREVTPVLWLWIFASAAEVVVVDLLLPWQTVRVVALVLGAWGLMWMVGLLASLRVHPHLIDAAGLRVRHGATVDLPVPWEAVASVAVQRRDLPSSMWTLQPRPTDSGIDLQVGVSGQVNVHLVLRRPTRLRTHKGDQVVTGLSFWADEPRELSARVRQALATGVTSGTRP